MSERTSRTGTTLRRSAAAVLLLATTGAWAAITTEDLTKVLGGFSATINGQSIGATGIGLQIDGGTPFWLGAGNITNVVNAVAAAADIQLTFKDGVSIPIVTLTRDVNITVLGPQSLGAARLADFSFAAGATWNPDPAISFPISVLNRTSTTQTYSFSTTMLLTPVLTPSNSPSTLVKSSLTGTLRSDGNGTVSIAPVPLAGAIVNSSVASGMTVTSMNVPVGNAQSFAAGVNGQVYTYAGQFNAGPTAAEYTVGPTPSMAGFTSMTQTVAFSLSAGDRATLVAFTEILPVPEAGTHAMLAAGLAVLALMARRRKV